MAISTKNAGAFVPASRSNPIKLYPGRVVTVAVTDGVVYVGVRTARAFVWIEEVPAPSQLIVKELA